MTRAVLSLACLAFAAADAAPLPAPDARAPLPSRPLGMGESSIHHHLQLIRPDPTRRFHLLVVLPDPDVDFHFQIVAPGGVAVAPPR